MVLREFPKGSQAQLGHLDLRDLKVLQDLQGMDSQDLLDDQALQVHQDCLVWANQVCQDCQASLEEMGSQGHKEKWAQVVERGQWDSQGPRVHQDHLGCQE